MDNWQYKARSASLKAKYEPEFMHARADGWDGASSIAITSAVIDYALFLASCIGERIVEVSPNQDGSLAFSWELDQNASIYLDVGPGRFVHAFIKKQDGNSWEQVVRWDDSTLLLKLEEVCPGFCELYDSKKSLLDTRSTSIGSLIAVASSSASSSGTISLSVRTSTQNNLRVELHA